MHQNMMETLIKRNSFQLDDLQSVIENSFNFEVNHVLSYNPKFTYDLLFKLANQQKTLKSVNFNIYRYANPQQSELDQNREILATLYQHVNEQYNTIFLKNFLYEDKYVKQQNLSEGIVSYSHLVDMLKLMHFRGSLVFEYNKNLDRNVEFIDQLLQSSKYILSEKHKLGEEHESHIVDGDTMPPIDI
ncbi:unnamed protein product [Paramecium primaurelia]|uniref:Uncharacterized protein n=1 Tax=Paramecium primaurelia TaxID=5886 RepID=A0A8S1PW92_PARPR|nr:unnamed protein product [Paramecium primaurelia]